jgi:hypothetical protein
LRLRWLNRILVVAIVLELIGATAGVELIVAQRFVQVHAAEAAPPSAASARTYVGSAVCFPCHESEAKLWNGSHHQLAIDACGSSADATPGEKITRHAPTAAKGTRTLFISAHSLYHDSLIMTGRPILASRST